MIFSGIGFNDLIVEPHVGDGHAVLSQRSGFVGANGRRGSERFDGFQILDQTVLASHAFGSERQTDGDGGEQTFGYVGHDDADQEDDRVQPLVAQRQSDDEERHAQEDGHAGNDVDEVLNFASDRRLARFQTRCQTGDSAHDRVVADVDDDTARRT